MLQWSALESSDQETRMSSYSVWSKPIDSCDYVRRIMVTWRNRVEKPLNLMMISSLMESQKKSAAVINE